MIACLTLRGLDSALLLALPGYSPVSIALFDSPSGALSCLRAHSRDPSLSLGPSISCCTHPPTIKQVKNPSATG
ncbi:hypothetical protein PBY51_011012 [Eleginops maclovinus]|uniref:Secreted protein n=1 Tax=Eleginops maclovinus TaxID=56733 RepID=A0AAN7XAB7_ELEMC|nr:hypothetical protein PBY51_011012 [Eleginops maclovinus]